MAKRSPMSIQLAKAKSASDVAQIIADSWVGYGLEAQEDESGDKATVTITTQPKTWNAAMKALWLKPKAEEGDATVFRMVGMNYELVVTGLGGDEETDAKLSVTIQPKTSTKTKETQFDEIIKHLPGQHTQQSHGRKGSGGGGGGSTKLRPGKGRDAYASEEDYVKAPRREGGWGKSGIRVPEKISKARASKEVLKVGKHLASNKAKIPKKKYAELNKQGQEILNAVKGPLRQGSRYAKGAGRLNSQKLSDDLNGLLDDIDEAAGI